MKLGMVLVPAIVLLAACSDDSTIATCQGDLCRADALSITIGGELFYTNEAGIRVSQLAFDTAFQWVGEEERELRGVDLLVFNDDGSERAHLTSDRGEASFEGRQMKAIGNVVLLVRSNGTRIESEELNFDPYGDRVWSEVRFRLLRPGQDIRGCSFSSDLNIQNFNSTGPNTC